MSQELTTAAFNASQQLGIEPEIVLEFDEYSKRFGPATIAASEKVVAKYRSSVTQTVTDGNTIDYATKVFDSHDAVTVGASWVFTAPKSGYYKVSANNSTQTVTPSTTNEVFRLAAQVNGSTEDIGDPQTATNTSAAIRFASSISTMFELQAGDTINIVFGENLPATNLDGSGANNWTVIESV